MHSRRIKIAVALIAVVFSVEAGVAQFAMFPKTGELVAPDGRYMVRNIDADTATSDFIGTFHSLWLTEMVTGRSRKLCDYMGLAAVAWSSNDFLLVTQYMGRRTSRALVFSAARAGDLVTLDQPVLIGLVPADLRPTLRENDHIFIEASRLEQETLQLKVWGYGQHDPNGFRWNCAYALREGTASCTKESVR
jgi:hypothetical protein